MTNNIVCADVLEWAAGYTGEKFHAVLCDPPYDYAFMGKDWDDAVAMHKETWAALAEHLLPGGFLMAFGGSRTFHRLACAIEDAGLIIHPAIGYLQGQGFPKATRIKPKHLEGVHPGRDKLMLLHNEPASIWDDHRYGKQAMKPALEMICLAQKPYEGKPVESIVETGAGALNIGGGRIGTDAKLSRPERRGKGGVGGWAGYEQEPGEYGTPQGQGRWPANFALVHSPGCRLVGTRKVESSNAHFINTETGSVKPSEVYGQYARNDEGVVGYADADGTETVADWECEETCPVRRLGEQSGERPSSGGAAFTGNMIYGKDQRTNCNDRRELGRGDKGTAARFFHNASWSHEIAERLAESDNVRYQAKAGRKERDAGLDGMPEGTKRIYGEGIISADHPETAPGGGNRKARNLHPTIKPIALTQWLATLLLPPDAYAPRRILVPFAGSGSEAIGAMLAGWDEIVGIEMMPDYCDIARARLAWWTEQAAGQMWPDVKEILKMELTA